MAHVSSLSPERIHPALWRASQLARGQGGHLPSGYTELNNELPGNGWPQGQLTEILLPQMGTAELSLLKPALSQLDGRPIVLLTPPYIPQALAFSCKGLQASQLIWIRCHKHVDALWAAEQVLRNSSCGALLFWASNIRSEALRRLHLAAQSSETLFFLMRNMRAAQQASPAPLRLSVQTSQDGLELGILKRRGSQRDVPLALHVPDHPYLHAYAHPGKEKLATIYGNLPSTMDSRSPSLTPA
ncbi:MAG: translesion DNA synthesis-associated protein ImuA [Burkholderiales bacterium]|nr:translesion DNA synthesis-associated protein ImuA [Burkholderiales bacterium]MBI3731414.1 translesion DNA synthesis-associated protein ImuA [Burkholderiales bacterium]